MGGLARDHRLVRRDGEPLTTAVASLHAHHTYLQGLGADQPSPAELVESILGDSGRAPSVERPVLFEVFDI